MIAVPVSMTGEWFFSEATCGVQSGADRALWRVAAHSFDGYSVGEVLGHPVGWIPLAANSSVLKSELHPPEFDWSSLRAPRERFSLKVAMNRTRARLKAYPRLKAFVTWWRASSAQLGRKFNRARRARVIPTPIYRI
jgi:hypothetical protein